MSRRRSAPVIRCRFLVEGWGEMTSSERLAGRFGVLSEYILKPWATAAHSLATALVREPVPGCARPQFAAGGGPFPPFPPGPPPPRSGEARSGRPDWVANDGRQGSGHAKTR